MPNVKSPWFIAFFSLFIGALFYYFFRAENIFFSAIGIEQHTFQLTWFFGSVPSFIHVYAMSILTWLSFDRTKKVVSITIWLCFNLLFEFGQLINGSQLPFIPSVLETYLIHGTFSWFDIVAIFFGGLASYFTLSYCEGRWEHA